ncbi:MAG: MmgE/PrpD family protein, partial [Mesorhizobium sp.]
PESLADETVIALAEKVEVRYPTDLVGHFPNSTPARVAMMLGQRQAMADVPLPLGDANNPMDQSAIETKFRDLARDMLSPSECDSLIQAVTMLKQDKLSPLLKCLNAH